jgi:DNA topoisomerase-1
LDSSCEVLASYGHVRDLPEKSDQIPEAIRKEKWARLGVNVTADYEPIYVVSSDKSRHVAALRAAAKGADKILLATDEDREGESISWHILQLLKPKKSTVIQRIVFHEITPEAIEEALANPRDLDEDLVKAQETRRILDRLYGYTLSPLLWKKVAPKLSAGRVQSVAVRLVVQRERARKDFTVASYAGIEAALKAADGSFTAKLTRVDADAVASGQSFNAAGQLSAKSAYWLKEPEAKDWAGRLKQTTPWTVSAVDKKPGTENPPAPFMTSTLQQEANRKFGWTARRTMQTAQQLYEGIDVGGERTGLITYMRTDSLTLASRALNQAREVIAAQYGADYLPSKPRIFKSKAKNAQEAHEAIRPTELSRLPQAARSQLSDDQAKLYELIWKRTIACQMQPARVERTRVEVQVQDTDKLLTFGASGKSIIFPGFLRAYVEGSDEPDAELGDRETILPKTSVGETLQANKVDATTHATKPPARYTEATLIRTLEAEGVGRPSTYASIMGTIQDRGYIFKRKNELIPTFTAFAVIDLLEGHFDGLVDLGFTAQMEEELDEIAEGKRDSLKHLKDFYEGHDEVPGIDRQVAEQGKDIPYPNIELAEDLAVRIGRNGPFIQRGEGGQGNTASVPDDMPPADLTAEDALKLIELRSQGPEALGTDPATGRKILLKSGRFGAYLELEATAEETEAKTKPKRVTMPPKTEVSDLSEEEIIDLVSLPRSIGKHPETGDDIMAAIGKYGGYLRCGDLNGSLKDWRHALTVTVDEAMEVLKQSKARANKEPIKVFGVLDGIEGEVKLMAGRYGPYVTNGKVNATIPKDIEPEAVTAEKAAELVKAKIAAGPSKKRFTKRRKKS